MGAVLALLGLDTATWAVIGVVGVVVLGVAWFGIRFWLAATRPADIKEIRTPALDRANQAALEAMGGAKTVEPESEDAPEGLKKVVPEEEK